MAFWESDAEDAVCSLPFDFLTAAYKRGTHPLVAKLTVSLYARLDSNQSPVFLAKCVLLKWYHSGVTADSPHSNLIDYDEYYFDYL